MTTTITSVSATQSKLQVSNQDSFAFDNAGGLSSVTSVNAGYMYGNRVINGNQEIDQVNAGAAVTPASTAWQYLTDMFGAYQSVGSKLTYQQVADAPAGMKNSLKVTVASQYSPGVGESFILATAIEGKDVIDFQMGTAGAATFTLSQWIKSSIVGTYAVAIRNNANNRTYLGTISVTTSWSQVKITIQGDVTGTWATDNTQGLMISWDLGSGTNVVGVTGWQAGAFLRTAGSVTFVNQSAGATLNITGVDCRLGTTAPTVFERRANELQLVQRYYETVDPSNYAAESAYGAGVNPRTYWWFKVTKRTFATVVNSGASASGILYINTAVGVGLNNSLGNNAVFGATANASARLF